MLWQGNGKKRPVGVDMEKLAAARALGPMGAAIEARIYAEDCSNNFLPSPGMLAEVEFPTDPWVRVDTWVRTGTEVTANFDPLIAKLMVQGAERPAAVERIADALSKTMIKGSTTNLKYLSQIVVDADFVSGNYDLQILSRVGMLAPAGMRVIDPGMYSSIQDYPGRAAKDGFEMDEFWRIGIPPSGPADDYSFRLANALVGNVEAAAGLEFTVKGPKLVFNEPTIIAVCGAAFLATLDGKSVPLHESIAVAAGATLDIGVVAPGSGGQRGYVAVAGGFDVPIYLGSRSTFPLGAMGGHQGRPLVAGDVVPLGTDPAVMAKGGGAVCPPLKMPAGTPWVVGCVLGPHEAPDFLTEEGMALFFATQWCVQHNSNRNGVRLLGPKPIWARPDGGAGGSHPSNVIDNEYAVGTINFTGDMPIFIGRDGPSLGGFVSNVTVPQAEMWKMGQVRPNDLISFEPIVMSQALARRTEQQRALRAIYETSVPANTPPLREPIDLGANPAVDRTGSILYTEAATAQNAAVCCRLQGDEYVLVEYGPPEMDLNLRFRVEGIERYLRASPPAGLLETAPGVRSLQIRYDNTRLSIIELEKLLKVANVFVPPADTMKIETRVLHLPAVLHDKWCQEAVQRYMQSNKGISRPYLPDNSAFTAKANGLAGGISQVNSTVLSASYMVLGLGDVYLGCPAALPVNPLHRIVTPKYNPARTYTPQGAIGIGGSFMCLYPTASPGGYQLVGRSLPIWNAYTVNALYEEGKPWLLRMFDQVRFYEVSEPELEELFELFKHGLFVPRMEMEVFDVAAYNEWVNDPEMATAVKAFERQVLDAQAAMAHEWTDPAEMPALEATDLDGASGPGDDSDDNDPTATKVAAPCSANTWKVVASKGDVVEEGDGLVVLEAMKMEYTVKAPCAGVVTVVKVKEGDFVNAGDCLATIKAKDALAA